MYTEPLAHGHTVEQTALDLNGLRYRFPDMSHCCAGLGGLERGMFAIWAWNGQFTVIIGNVGIGTWFSSRSYPTRYLVLFLLFLNLQCTAQSVWFQVLFTQIQKFRVIHYCKGIPKKLSVVCTQLYEILYVPVENTVLVKALITFDDLYTHLLLQSETERKVELESKCTSLYFYKKANRTTCL